MKTILVTGSNGQLGRKIKDNAQEYTDYNFIYTDVEELDITNRNDVFDFFTKNKIDFVINCAAYTQVDKAEQEPVKVSKINTDGPENLAIVCQKNSALQVHISTDYVFGNSSQNTPFTEKDPIKPNSIYGKTKAEAEERLKKYNDTIIIRTAWLYSEYGNNFLKTMIRFGNQKEKLSVVYDQISTPTYAGDLAKAILIIIQKRDSAIRNQQFEILHYTNTGICSWYDFAYEIFKHENINCKLNAIRSVEYPTPAKRPPYSVLDKSKIQRKYHLEIPDYRKSLYFCLRKLNLNN